MDSTAILDELMALLEAADVSIRRDALGGSGGGLCHIKGKNIFFLDIQATPVEAAAKCAEALVKVTDVETIYITPEVRQLVEKYKAK